MRQMTIFDYLNHFYCIGDTIDPAYVRETIRFSELGDLAGELVAWNDGGNSFRVVQILPNFKSAGSKNRHSCLLDIGNHTCISISEEKEDRLYRIEEGAIQMVHVSFDQVDNLVPRIPEQRVEGNIEEDRETKRICVSTSVLGGLRGIPQAAGVLSCMDQLGLPKIVHAYYLTGKTYYPTKKQVPDRDWTYEHWLLESPETVVRKDFFIAKYETLRLSDVNGIEHETIINATIEPTRYQDNIDNLCNLLQIRREKYPETISFRTLITNFGNDLINLKTRLA